MDNYDYGVAGFDGFLSRSIDDLTQVTLDSQGPQTTQMRYDSAQISGPLGNILQLGKLRLDGANGAIILNDGQNDVLYIGTDNG